MSLDEMVEWMAERILRQREESGEESAEQDAAAKQHEMIQTAKAITEAKGGKDLRRIDGDPDS